ncbi:MAG: NAD-dependent epimerase/dehydratase family protein [Planctomycetes bacterium]|nr:NAD-dependent epimerase/dehydratase family protein [Planctomycetota bacterium]
MSERVLVTGGAGFIGSHLADALLARGRRVRVLDVLSPQVHGPERRAPAYLSPDVDVRVGDVRDPAAVRDALEGVDAVVHLAAAVGVGQSMYELEHYVGMNDVGTAVLLEALLERPVRRLVVASSMSVYGEGRYRRPDGRLVAGARRARPQLERGRWELEDEDGAPLTPVPTPEAHPCELASVYALTKYDQERLCLMIGAAYSIPAVALRFFNVYGPRQALSNPYTGVLAIFAARYLNDRPPVVFEDGLQRRDFVSVHDVARACCLALERDGVEGEVFNVGSGQPRTVLDVATGMARVLGKEGAAPEVTGEYRFGDIRHCFADISRARQRLGYAPEVDFEAGLEELARWLRGQRAADHVAVMRQELSTRGLTLGSSEAA